MKIQLHLTQGLTISALLVIGTLAVAQTAPQKKTSSSNHPSGNQPSGLAVDHAGGNGVRRAVGNPAVTPQPATTTEAPAAPTTTTGARKHPAGVKYQDRTDPGKTGENPLFEPKDKANLKPAATTGPSPQ